jgi:hypothetical protein
MARRKPWYARVWKEDGCWQWDVRMFGQRSTGGRPTWREAYDVALSELLRIRAVLGEVN